MKKDLLKIDDLTKDEIIDILNLADQLKYELKQSKTKIEEELNTIISVIAYPNGEYNDKVLEFSKKMGYNFAFSVENKSFQISDKDFQIIPRILVYHQKFWKLSLQFIKLRIENH